MKAFFKRMKPLYKKLQAKKRAERKPDDPFQVRTLDGSVATIDPKTQPRLAQTILPGEKIYLFQIDNTQYFKVGFTKGNAFRRMQALQQSNPLEMTLIACKPGTKSDEKALLNKLAPYRTRGEWFEIPDATVFPLLATEFQLISLSMARFYSKSGLTLAEVGEIYERRAA